jgi:hypothetical protein
MARYTKVNVRASSGNTLISGATAEGDGEAVDVSSSRVVTLALGDTYRLDGEPNLRANATLMSQGGGLYRFKVD